MELLKNLWEKILKTNKKNNTIQTNGFSFLFPYIPSGEPAKMRAFLLQKENNYDIITMIGNLVGDHYLRIKPIYMMGFFYCKTKRCVVKLNKEVI